MHVHAEGQTCPAAHVPCSSSAYMPQNIFVLTKVAGVTGPRCRSWQLRCRPCGACHVRALCRISSNLQLLVSVLLQQACCQAEGDALYKVGERRQGPSYPTCRLTLATVCNGQCQCGKICVQSFSSFNKSCVTLLCTHQPIRPLAPASLNSHSSLCCQRTAPCIPFADIVSRLMWRWPQSHAACCTPSYTPLGLDLHNPHIAFGLINPIFHQRAAATSTPCLLFFTKVHIQSTATDTAPMIHIASSLARRSRIVPACDLLRRGYAAEPSMSNPSGGSSEDLHGFRTHVRDFVRSLITPEMAESIDKNNEFPHKSQVDLWKEMGSFGLLGTFHKHMTRPFIHG